MKKRIFSIVLCLALLLGLTACGGGFTPAQTAFNTEVKSSTPSSDEIIATNDKYTLQYDAETGGVNLLENGTENKWEVTPTPQKPPQLNSFGLPMKQSPYILSTLLVGYMDKNIVGGGDRFAVSYTDAVESGRMVYKPIKNDNGTTIGVTIEYYFDNQKFMIPVDYVLKNDYLSISIDTDGIQEDEYKITTVSLAPFLSAVENDTPDSYLFMPSGSGALIDTTSYSAQGLLYDAYVYGEDATKEEQYDSIDDISVRLPVYGYKNGELGGFAIIDNGSDAAVLSTSSGNTAYGFSTIYPTFHLRGYTEHKARAFNSTYVTKVFSNNMLDGTFSIRFYPLKGENANYSGMADIYRNYLISECGLTKNDNEKVLNLNIIGGTEITKSFVGIPYTTVYATTTVQQANSIITELSNSISDMSVKLKGFGASGVDVGKIGGGYKLSDKIGSSSQLKKLASACTDNKIDLYMDYDLVRFSSSGSGFSYSSDVVMNSGYIKADQYIIDKAIRTPMETNKYRLLRPTMFDDAVEKSLSASAKWNLSGVSLDTLSSLSYSDYSDKRETVKYNSKHGFSDAVLAALEQVKESEQKLMVSDANVYAAIIADLITDAPTASMDAYAFIEDVPFYAMVFKGYVPMTTESLNLADSADMVFLNAVEGGLGLNYTITNNWDSSLIDAVYPWFYSTAYSTDNSTLGKDIVAKYDEYAKYFNSVKGAEIVSNSVIASGVHCTVFSNGVTVYVNYNDTPCQTPAGEVAAMSYITGGAA